MVTKVGNTVAPQEFVEWFNQDTDTTTGLTFGYKAGSVMSAAGVITNISAGTVALTDDAINIVYVDFSGTPAIAAAVSTSKPTQATSMFLFIVTTASGSISEVLSLRNWLVG